MTAISAFLTGIPVEEHPLEIIDAEILNEPEPEEDDEDDSDDDEEEEFTPF